MVNNWRAAGVALLTLGALILAPEPFTQSVARAAEIGQVADDGSGDPRRAAGASEMQREDAPTAVVRAPPSKPQPEAPQPKAQENIPAPGGPQAPEPPVPLAEDAIEKLLLERVSAQFSQTELSQVMEHFRDALEIDIIIDEGALANVGIDADTPITVHLEGVPFRSALDLILEPYELSWTVRSGLLLITGAVEAESMAVTRLYDVADLVTYRDEDGELWEDYDTLVNTILQTVEPDEWDVAGGPGSIRGATFATAKLLIVSQRYQIHQKLSRFLDDVRRIAGTESGDREPPAKNRPKPPSAFSSAFGPGVSAGGAPSSTGLGYLGPSAVLPQAARGTVVVVAQENVELKAGDKLLGNLPKGAKLPVLDVHDTWVGVSVLMDGKETLGWVRSRDVEPLPPAAVPGASVPGPQAVDGASHTGGGMGMFSATDTALAQIGVAIDKPGADDPFGSAPPSVERPAQVDPFADDPFGRGVPSMESPAEEDPFADDPFAGPPAPARPAARTSAPRRWPASTQGLRWGEQVVQQELDEPTDIEACDMELPLLVDYLCKKHRIYVVVDQQSLNSIGWEIDTPVRFKVSGVPLHSALEAMLKPLDLNWTIRHGVLLITSEESAQNNRVTRVYDVGELVTCRDENGQLWDDYDTLTAMIQATVEPLSWHGHYSGGTIEGATFGTAKALVVAHNYQAQHQVKILLDKLHKAVREKGGNGKPPLRSGPKSDFRGLGGTGSVPGGMGWGFF